MLGNSFSRSPAILINLGDTIPDIPDIRLGTLITRAECESMGDFGCPDGGYLVWNDGSDWFVVPKEAVLATAAVPDALSQLRNGYPPKAPPFKE